jgi:hypothetical protein
MQCLTRFETLFMFLFYHFASYDELIPILSGITMSTIIIDYILFSWFQKSINLSIVQSMNRVLIIQNIKYYLNLNEQCIQ